MTQLARSISGLQPAKISTGQPVLLLETSGDSQCIKRGSCCRSWHTAPDPQTPHLHFAVDLSRQLSTSEHRLTCHRRSLIL